MNRSLNLASAVTALLLMTILTGCDLSSSPGQAPLAVAVPVACETILKGVIDPIDSAKVADNALALLAQYRGALGLANGRIYKARDCIAKVRTGFSSAK